MKKEIKSTVEGNIPFQKTAKYHLCEGREGYLMHSFRNMYGDPVLAVLREYLSNALDIHRDPSVNSEDPIEINLPGEFSSELVFRDYGTGLSNEDFERHLLGYGSVGESKNSDRKQIGGFGIGGKSFFAISDFAMFTVYYEGYASTWLCEPMGGDGNGLAKLLKEEPTEEKNGIEIRIPVDTNAYPPASMKNKLKALTAYLDYPVRIDDKLHESLLQENLNKDENLITFKIPELGGNAYIAPKTYTSVNYYSSFSSPGPGDQNIKIIINGIPYPLETSFMLDTAYEEGRQTEAMKCFFLHNHIAVTVPEGLMELAPPRESFIKNKITKEGAMMIWDLMQDYLKSYTEESLNEQPTERLALLRELEFACRSMSSHFGRDFKWGDKHGGVLDVDKGIPYRGKSITLRESFSVSGSEIEKLEGKVWLCSYTVYKTKKEPRKSARKILFNVSQKRPVNIRESHRVGEHGMHHVSVPSIMLNPKNYISNQEYPYPDSYNTWLFFSKIPLYWVSEKANADSLISKYLRDPNRYAKNCSNSIFMRGDFKGPTANEKFASDMGSPFIVVKGSKKVLERALEVFKHVTEYKGDLNTEESIVRRREEDKKKRKEQRKYKTDSTQARVASSTGASELEKPKRAKKWYNFIPGDKSESLGCKTPESCNWELVEVPEKKFLYTVISHYMPYYDASMGKIGKGYAILSGNNDLAKLIGFLRKLKKCNTPLLNNVYGIKPADINRIPEHAERFEVYAYKILEEWFSEKSSKFVISPSQLLFLNKQGLCFNHSPKPYWRIAHEDIIQIRCACSMLDSILHSNSVRTSAYRRFSKNHPLIKGLEELKKVLKGCDKEIVDHFRGYLSYNRNMEVFAEYGMPSCVASFYRKFVDQKCKRSSSTQAGEFYLKAQEKALYNSIVCVMHSYPLLSELFKGMGCHSEGQGRCPEYVLKEYFDYFKGLDMYCDRYKK